MMGMIKLIQVSFRQYEQTVNNFKSMLMYQTTFATKH